MFSVRRVNGVMRGDQRWGHMQTLDKRQKNLDGVPLNRYRCAAVRERLDGSEEPFLTNDQLMLPLGPVFL